MPQIFPGRYTATHDGPVTVFLIGMRLNQPLRADLWWPVFSAMPRMLAHLAKDHSAGMLGFQNWFLPSPVVLSYWRSPEHLQRFAANPDAPHLRPWRAFNKAVGNSGAVGIWHETYQVSPGQREVVYVNMPEFGLAKAGDHVPVGPGMATARQRMATAR